MTEGLADVQKGMSVACELVHSCVSNWALVMNQLVVFFGGIDVGFDYEADLVEGLWQICPRHGHQCFLTNVLILIMTWVNLITISVSGHVA